MDQYKLFIKGNAFMPVIIKTVFSIIAGIIAIFSLSGCTVLGMKSIPAADLEKKYGDAYSKYVKIGDTNVFYRDQGTGPVLILLHGVCASSLTWDGWVKELGDQYRIIRMDVPAFGITGPVKKELFERDNAVKFLDKFLNALGLDRVYLAGNSLGAYMAWNYALDHPEKVEKLIVIDPLSYNQKIPGILRFASNPLVSPTAKYIMPKFLIDMSVTQVYGDKSKVTDKVKDTYFDMAMREGNKGSYIMVFKVFKEKVKNEVISRGISQIKTPTLVMWGTKDEWIPFEYFNSWKADLPSATYISYEGIGHVPMEEIPEITAKDAHEFLMSKQ